MKISAKDNPTDVVICICGWSGQIHDAYWIHELEFGKCPDCGKEDQFEFEVDEEDILSHKWEYDGWKARVIVYGMMTGALIFGLIPWIWGLIEEFKFVYKLFF